MGVCLAFNFNLLAMFRPTCCILGSTLICIPSLSWSVCPQGIAGDPATTPQRPPPAPFSAAPLVGAASALAPPLGSLPRAPAAPQVAQAPAAASPLVVAGPPASAAAPAADASAAGAGLCSAAVQHNLDLQQAWSHAWHLDSQRAEVWGEFYSNDLVLRVFGLFDAHSQCVRESRHCIPLHTVGSCVWLFLKVSGQAHEISDSQWTEAVRSLNDSF